MAHNSSTACEVMALWQDKIVYVVAADNIITFSKLLLFLSLSFCSQQFIPRNNTL